METIRPFQIGLLAGFGLIAVVSLILLASYQGVGGQVSNPYGSKVVIWGTFEQAAFTEVIQAIGREDRNFQSVSYVQKDSRSFADELVNAIAEGRGPDLVLLDHENLVSLRPKLQPISYDIFSTRTLRDNYVDGFEVFARSNGLYAVPLFVDPLVMYWNRDLFATGGLALPPATWESLVSTAEQLTLRDARRDILQSTVAFGEYENVQDAKGTLLALLLQSGSDLVREGATRYEVGIDTSSGDTSRRPLFSTLQFFVEFSNVSSPLYSWNRTFDSDLSAFLGEKLTLYFAYGSESARIRQQNPNLNFDVVGVPQGAGATVKRTYGRFYGLAVVAASQNQSGAYQAALKLAADAPTATLSERLGLAPAHRSSLTITPEDPVRQTIFSQALIARGWLDPDPQASDETFRQMIEDVVSGRSSVGSAVADTTRRLELAF
jgi:ABC-type glycerol-3-phosphate transport system substrate-binding protein